MAVKILTSIWIFIAAFCTGAITTGTIAYAATIPCTVKHLAWKELAGTLMVDGVLERATAQRIYLQLYDGEKFLGNENVRIQPGGSFSAMMSGLDKMPSDFKIKYTCGD